MEYFKKILEYVDPINKYECIDTILEIDQEGKKFYIEFDYDNKIIPVYQNAMSDHLIRYLKINKFQKISENNAFDLFMFLDSVDLMSVCTVCGNKINSYEKISCCQESIKPDCNKKFVELITDNILTDFYTNDKIALNFLILSAYACLKHALRDEIFKPFPPNFDSIGILEKKIKYNHTNITSLLEIIKSSKSDYEIFDKIGLFDYSFLKFIILSNTTMIRSDLLFNENKNIFDQKSLETIFDDNEVITFRVDQDPIVNKRFEGIELNYLFSGSCLSNWYSIMRNGIKVYSGTKMMLHGAARGSGVYLSDTLRTSYSYGIDKYCASNMCVYGVFQVFKSKSSYQKDATVYVVPYENELALRYLIVFKNNSLIKFPLEKIDKYFMIEKEKEINMATNNYNSIREKRICYDISKIKKICQKENFEMNVTKIKNTECTNKIEIVGKNTIISIKFFSEYPNTPPHIWISETTRIINHPDILKKGGIMNRKLSHKYWETGNEIHKIIKEIINSITDENIIKIKNNEEDSFNENIIKIKNNEEDSFNECVLVSKIMV